MEELKVEIQFLKSMINLHQQLGNKGLEQIFQLKLNRLINELVELIK